MFNRLIAWSLNNRLLVLAIAVIGLVAGGFMLQSMPKDVFPEFAPPQVVIQTEAPGLAPKDVEALITYPLESAINGTTSVDIVRSSSSVGLSTIVVVFQAGTDIYLDRQLVNERVQSVVGNLPAGTQPPVMLPVTSAVGWLVKYSLTSRTLPPMELRTFSDWEVRPRLLSLGGIASVVSMGGEVKQYQVRLDPMRLLAYRVTADDVRHALEQANVNVPGAFLQRSGQELIVSGQGRVQSLQDLRQTVIAVRNGVPITLANVADVGFGAEIKRGDSAFGLQPAVIGTVSKAYGADTVKTTAKVEEALAEIRRTLPAGVEMNTEVFRQANFIDAALNNLSVALIEGALIVIAVLFLFLMNWRASFVTFVSMPASFVGGIIVMYLLGIGINAMTLGGLAIAIGEVVDNGIITVENVVRRLRLYPTQNSLHRKSHSVGDVSLEQQIRVPQLDIRVDRSRAARYGVHVGDVLKDVELYLNGETVSKISASHRALRQAARAPCRRSGMIFLVLPAQSRAQNICSTTAIEKCLSTAVYFRASKHCVYATGLALPLSRSRFIVIRFPPTKVVSKVKNSVQLMMGAVALSAVVLAAPAQAAPHGVNVGTLTCNVASGWGFVFGSSKDLHCTFREHNRKAVHYNGTISKFGMDIGYTEGGVLIWGVVAPSSDVRPGSLDGDYVGASAGATVGVGVGANVLIGGFGKSITLQPLSVSGNRGLNVAAGIGSISLKQAP